MTTAAARAEAGRVREDAEREPEEDRARGERERGAHAVPDTRLRGLAGHGVHLSQRPPGSCCHNRGVKIVVSGASGLIGSALVPALRAEGHDVCDSSAASRRAPTRSAGIRPQASSTPRAYMASSDRQPERREHRPALDRTRKREILESRYDRDRPAREDGRRARPPALASSSAPAESASTAIAATRS